MQAMRILALAAVVVTGLASTSFAQRINAPGDYVVNVVVDPNMVPPGLPVLGPNVYSGTATIMDSRHGPRVRFRGTSPEGHRLTINATFMSGWVGMLVTDYNLGGTIVPDAVVGMDVSWMMEGKLNGVGNVDGVPSRVNARFGQAGTLIDIKVKPL